MFLQSLELKKFRNYSNLNLEFSPGINIFYGENAQGKTNILEAVAILGLGRSFRTKKENELIQWQAESAYLKGVFQDHDLVNVIEYGIGNSKKRVKINSQEVKPSQIFSQVPVVIFTPDDLQLVKAGPQGRRDFMDLYLAQIEPKYRYVYYNFYKVLQQRNRFLKEMRFTPAESEVWDEQLIAKGTKVIKYRAELTEKIKPYICEAHQRISQDHELLNIDYTSLGSTINHLKDESEIRKVFEAELRKVKNLEFERKMTLIGPQRDDLLLTINGGVELRTYGSQGQQRTASLALKLGMIDILSHFRGTNPILLLDDVMSEFDNERKKALLRMLIHSSQTFLTSTSITDFPINSSESVAFYRIKQGEAFNVN